MGIQRQAFEETFKQTEIYVREVNLRQKYILAFSNTMNGYFNIVANDAWNMWQQAQKVAVPDGFVLVEIPDLREIISTASDAMMDERTSSVYNETGEPSTWFDHYAVAEKQVLIMIEAQEKTND